MQHIPAHRIHVVPDVRVPFALLRILDEKCLEQAREWGELAGEVVDTGCYFLFGPGTDVFRTVTEAMGAAKWKLDVESGRPDKLIHQIYVPAEGRDQTEVYLGWDLTLRVGPRPGALLRIAKLRAKTPSL